MPLTNELTSDFIRDLCGALDPVRAAWDSRHKNALIQMERAFDKIPATEDIFDLLKNHSSETQSSFYRHKNKEKMLTQSLTHAFHDVSIKRILFLDSAARLRFLKADFFIAFSCAAEPILKDVIANYRLFLSAEPDQEKDSACDILDAYEDFLPKLRAFRERIAQENCFGETELHTLCKNAAADALTGIEHLTSVNPDAWRAAQQGL